MNAVIIGGSGGIGRSISSMIAEKVGSLCIHAGHESESFRHLAVSLAQKTKIIPVVHSFSLDNGFDSFFSGFYESELYECMLNADILCICYGPFLQKAVHEMTDTEWVETSFFNFTWPGILVSRVLPGMMKRGFGRIVLFGGTKTDTMRVFKTNPAYGAAKTALCSIVKSVSAAYSQYGITCNAVLPGFVETEYITETEKKYYESISPGNSMLLPESAAKAVLYLIENPAVSGTLLTVDGGLNI